MNVREPELVPATALARAINALDRAAAKLRERHAFIEASDCDKAITDCRKIVSAAARKP